MKTKIQTKKLILIAIFCLVIGFGFGKGEKAEAAEAVDCSSIDPSAKGQCGCQNSILPDKDRFNVTCQACSDSTKVSPYKENDCTWAKNGTGYTWLPDQLNIGKQTVVANDSSGNYCSTAQSIHLVDCILLALLNFFVWLTTLASTIFTWIMDPKSITDILSSNAIYGGWTLVRDALNVSFIMFLLFSAFATVFQIDKYSYKKTLLTIVIMALLVNFSFPISRFVIDVSNMMMFYLADTLNIGSTKADEIVKFADVAGLPKILKSSVGANTTALLAAIVFVFIFAVTILTISILFLIRTIALAILIIFSSLAFVGAAIPPLSSYASDWWKKLFNYSFFGPIMLFMMYIASSLMTEISKSVPLDMAKIATNDTVAPENIATLSFFAIPIVILWMGLGIAQSMSIAGASAVVGKSKGFMSWAGKTFSGYRAITPAIHALDRNTLGKWGLSPRQFLHGWKESTKEAEETKLAYGKGLWHDRINYLTSFGKQKSNYAEIARQGLVSKKMKQVREVSELAPYLLDRMSNLMGDSSPESVAEIKSIFRILYGNNDQDEIMGYIKENIEKGTAIGKRFASKEFGFSKKNWGVSEKNVSNAVVKILGQSKGVSKEEIDKELLDLMNIAAAKQGVGYGSMFYDTETKQWVRVVGEEKYEGYQGWLSAAKMMTMGEAQNIPKLMHRNNFTDQEGGLNETGKALLRKYANPTSIKQADRHKSDFYRSICLDNDGEISKKMLEYAAALQNGDADGWDPNRDGKGKGGYSEKIKEEAQAINAAAWTAALKIKATGNISAVEAEVANFFKPEDVTKIMNLAKGDDIATKKESDSTNNKKKKKKK